MFRLLRKIFNLLCKKTVQKEKRELKKEKVWSRNDAWKGSLKTWDRWNTQSFQGVAPGPHKWGLPWTPSCKGQRTDAH